MTPEQDALVRKAQDSLRGAEVLASQKLFDFAVSRAYYTMFYVAEAFLLGEGLTFSKHSGVIAAFGQHFANTGRVPKEFHRYLIDGERKRLTGDYDIGPGLTEQEAQEQIDQAEKFLDLAKASLGSLP